MARCYPETIPAPHAINPETAAAYRQGWNHGHGIACHNVPRLGARLFVDAIGRVTVDAENIREVHQALCFEAESGSRQFSPFEFTAHAFNSVDDEWQSEALWEAFDAGTADAIAADLAEYDDSSYGIESEQV